MRQKFIAGNWKMHGLKKDLKEITEVAKYTNNCTTEVVICPPLTLLSKIPQSIETATFFFFSQNCHYNDYGAHTGEISPKMLNDIGLSYVILGHSERRIEHFEKNEILFKIILFIILIVVQ